VAVISVSLMLLVGLAAAAFLRSASAALRHYVLAAAIACAAAAPLAARIAPRWELTGSSRVALAPGVGHIVAIDATEDAPGAPARPDPPPPSRVDIAALIMPLWYAGAAVALLALGVGLVRLERVRRRAAPLAAPHWNPVVERLCRRYGITRPIDLLEGDERAPIVTWGVSRARILVPAGAARWPERRVEAVLAHELAHVQRLDWLAQMLAESVAALYWFNPLAWIAARRLRQESEHACDDAVLATGVAGVDYATELLALTRAARRSWLPAAAIARPSSLERRVRAMLNTDLNRRPTTRTAATLALAALVALTISISGYGVAAQTFSSFSGAVQDQFGKPIPGASLTLTDAAKQAKYEVKADASGQFEFIGLAPATYTLDVSVPGFMTFRASLTTDGRDAHDTVNLAVGSIEETLNVTSGGPAPIIRSAPASAQPPKSRCDAAVTSCIDVPVKLRDLRPVHPGVDGKVVLKGTLASDGTVRDLEPIGAVDQAQYAAVVTAVREWRYRPTRLDGIPIDIPVTVTTNFIAMPPPPPPPPPAPGE